MPEDFKAKAGEFEGPMDALLDLIEQRKLQINQVALGAIADDFIAHLKQLEGEQGSKLEMANFVLIAATLMLIKSVSLLPTLAVTPEEQESMAELERRLALYQRVRELSEGVRARFGRQMIWAREPSKNIQPIFTPTTELTTSNLLRTLKNLINALPKFEKLPEAVVKKILSLEEAISDLAGRVQSALKMSFKNFVGQRAEKINIIVSFLGLLELVKRGVVSVEQPAHFSDIQMESAETGVPKYL